MLRTYRGNFQIDEEVDDVEEIPSDVEVDRESVENYRTMQAESPKKRPASAMRGLTTANLETLNIESEAGADELNQDLRDLSPDRIDVRSRQSSSRPKLKYTSSVANLKTAVLKEDQQKQLVRA